MVIASLILWAMSGVMALFAYISFRRAFEFVDVHATRCAINAWIGAASLILVPALCALASLAWRAA